MKTDQLTLGRGSYESGGPFQNHVCGVLNMFLVLFTHQRRIRWGVQEVWAVWPVDSAVCKSAMMEASQRAASYATAVGVVGSNLLGQLNWAPKHVACPV